MALLALMFLVVFVLLPAAWLLWHMTPGWVWILAAWLAMLALIEMRRAARRRARLAELERFERRRRRETLQQQKTALGR
ncbi:MAG: hypothetical protein N3I86_06580 [Verrucomicrobiae bacterium]|nr:hypothetical protein [Verrucomicrobiae bacterium]MDW8308854.1 hypothetical protein [Verrucomicrobiales bacterium]